MTISLTEKAADSEILIECDPCSFCRMHVWAQVLSQHKVRYGGPTGNLTKKGLIEFNEHMGSSYSYRTARKKSFLTPQESQIFIDWLCNEQPSIKSKYKKQINYYIANINIKKAFELWNNESRAEARKCLVPYLKIPKVLIVYVSIWLMPYTFFRKFNFTSVNKLLSYSIKYF